MSFCVFKCASAFVLFSFSVVISGGPMSLISCLIMSSISGDEEMILIYDNIDHGMSDYNQRQ